MIDHIGIHPSSMQASRRFYGAALQPLAIMEVMEVRPEESGGYHGIGYGAGSKPFFWLSSDSRREKPADAGNVGLHIAFAAGSRAAVDAFYAAAMAQGGRDNGPPGLRPHYHPAYYAAFVLDPDGINIEAVCHTPGLRWSPVGLPSSCDHGCAASHAGRDRNRSSRVDAPAPQRRKE